MFGFCVYAQYYIFDSYIKMDTECWKTLKRHIHDRVFEFHPKIE